MPLHVVYENTQTRKLCCMLLNSVCLFFACPCVFYMLVTYLLRTFYMLVTKSCLLRDFQEQLSSSFSNEIGLVVLHDFL